MIQCPHCQVQVQPCGLSIHLHRWCKAQNTYANALEKRRERAPDQDQVAVPVQVESQRQQAMQEPDSEVLSSPGLAVSSVKNTLFDEVHSYSI